MPIDRRRFLLTTAAAATSFRSLGQAKAAAAPLVIHEDQPGPTIPANFVGLSYETQQLNDPTFFSANNTGLVAQFRALTPNGVLRLGGNTSDVGWWKPTPTTPQPPLPSTVVIVPPQPGSRPFQELAYSVTPDAVRNLRAFLDATGWTCLYGINLGSSTPARAAEEALFVARTLGPKLEYFQLGNEPDLFQHRFRDPATWTADLFFDQWLAAANAIGTQVPTARFALPDTAGRPDWYAAVVARLAALPNPPRVAALTHHYYFGGPPSNPDVNLDRLLQPNTHVLSLAHDISSAAAKLTAAAKLSDAAKFPIPFRMSEGNTCYRGGKPGVSDVFGAALWAADYFLLLASLGYSGINLHGGGGKAVADSLGGTLPGEALMPDPHAPHPRPFYTPIADMAGRYVPEPVFFGMKFAGALAGATLLKLDFNPGLVNATAYAAKLPSGQQVVALINKDKSQPLPINLARFSLGLTLSAPSLTSTHADLSEPSTFRETSSVPPATAVLLYETHS